MSRIFYTLSALLCFTRLLAHQPRPEPVKDSIALCADSLVCNPEIRLGRGEEKEMTVIVRAASGEKLFSGIFYKTQETDRIRILKDRSGKYKLVFDGTTSVRKKRVFFIMLHDRHRVGARQKKNPVVDRIQ